jgi:PTH1 family peptidyl-tRNA hydrolase
MNDEHPIQTPPDLITTPTYLIVGLGNPGREYRDTRHNIGFMVLDRLAERLGVRFSRMQFKALVTDGRYQDHKVLLAKPQTYMNSSGEAVGSLVNFYKLPLENLLVVYDDVDLPFETIRIRPEGGSGGHKGMKSIIEQLGTQAYPRMRLGIGRPPGRMEAADYVLKVFSNDEDGFLAVFLDRAAEAALACLAQGIEYAMTQYNAALEE